MTKYDIDTAKFESIESIKVKCKCGHTMPMTNKHYRVLCTFCGHFVYKTKLDEFKDRLKMERRK